MALCALSPSLATASSRVCVKKEERAALPSQKPRRSRKREEREKREGCEGAMTIDDEFDVFFSRSTCPLSQKSERLSQCLSTMALTLALEVERSQSLLLRRSLFFLLMLLKLKRRSRFPKREQEQQQRKEVESTSSSREGRWSSQQQWELPLRRPHAPSLRKVRACLRVLVEPPPP